MNVIAIQCNICKALKTENPTKSNSDGWVRIPPQTDLCPTCAAKAGSEISAALATETTAPIGSGATRGYIPDAK